MHPHRQAVTPKAVIPEAVANQGQQKSWPCSWARAPSRTGVCSCLVAEWWGPCRAAWKERQPHGKQTFLMQSPMLMRLLQQR